jgi:hypothetical protein
MAGLLANSVSVSMVSGSADASQAGFLTGEQIVLSTTPTAASYSWGVAKPSGSSGRAALSEDDVAAPVFTPDVAGYYVFTCTIAGGTAYVLRANVTALAVASPTQALRLSPVTDAQVEAPAVGMALYYSSTQSALCVKDANDDVFTVDVTAV